MVNFMSSRLQELFQMLRTPQVAVSLMEGAVHGKDAFYAGVTEDFYHEAMRRHPRLVLIRRLQYGVALCRLPPDFDTYFMMVEAAARRNFKKAQRNGYSVRRIAFNDYLADIAEIRASTEFRQGVMPGAYLAGAVTPCDNTPPMTATHDYPYWGILKDGKLVAYAGVMVAGEAAMIEHILGHAAYQGDGVVPLLIIGMAGDIMKQYPAVKYYGYGSYFGAGETMRRFKRKFCFIPSHVKWVLG